MKRVILAFVAFVSACFAQSGTITSPASGAAVNGWMYPLTSTVTGISNLAYTAYSIDGETPHIVEATEPSTSPSYVWDPYEVGNGTHTVQATFYDAAMNVLATSPAVSFHVWNYLPQNLIAYNATPTNAAGDLTATWQQTATFNIYAGATYVNATISFKPSTTITKVNSGVTGYGSTTGPSWNTTTGNLYAALVRIQSATATFTCADQAGDMFAYGQVAQSTGNGYSEGWCYALNITGHTANYVTVTSSATVYSIHAYELSGALTSGAKDIDAVVTGSTSTPSYFNLFQVISAGFNPSVNNEFVLNGASWGEAASTINAGPGFTLGTVDPNSGSAVEYATLSPSNGTFFGTIVAAITNDNITPSSLDVYVDGWTTGVGLNGVVGASIDTTQYPNGTYQLAAVSHGNNCPSCTNATWDYAGQSEITATFANGALPSQLITSVHDQPGCAVAQTGPPSCPSSGTVNVKFLNTDNSTAAATATACSVANTSVVTAALSGGACNWSYAGVGATSMTVTDSTGRTRTMYFEMYGSPNYNVLPHFGLDGQVHQTYSAANSILFHSGFATLPMVHPFLAAPYPGFPEICNGSTGSVSGRLDSQYGALNANKYVALGYTLFELDYGCTPAAYSLSQSVWEAGTLTDITNACAIAGTYGLPIGFRLGNWVSNTANLTPGSTWTPVPALQYSESLHQSITLPNGKPCGIINIMGDEVDSQLGSTPPAAVSTLYGWITGALGTNWPLEWPTTGAAGNSSYSSWQGIASSTAITDDVYWNPNTKYLPIYGPLSDIATNMLAQIRSRMTVMVLSRPFIGLSTGIVTDYALHGYQWGITSMSGNTLTLASDDGMRNVSVDSRLTISAASAGNGQYYIVGTPTATTRTLMNATFSFTTTGCSAGGTAYFSGGGTATVSSICTNNPGNCAGVSSGLLGSCMFTSTSVAAYRGQTFYVCGNASTNVNSGCSGTTPTFYLSWATLDSPTNEFILQIPSVTSTGGTATIQADDNMIPGRDWWAAYDGPRSAFASEMAPLLAGGSGDRCYGCASVRDATLTFDRTATGVGSSISPQTGANAAIFADTNFLDVQAGWTNTSNYAGSSRHAFARGNANLVTNVDKALWLQPRAASPDCGLYWECAVREDSNGQVLLAVQGWLDGPASFTANLAPYLISGQTIAKRNTAGQMAPLVTSLASGTSGDTTNCPTGGCLIVYDFATSGAASWLSQPQANYPLSAVPGASKIQLSWAYGCPTGNPQACYPLTAQALADGILPATETFSSMPATPNWDRNLGPIAIKVQYLSSTNKVLATFYDSK